MNKENSIVKITWKAFGNKPNNNRFISSVTFATNFVIENPATFLDVVYHNTNTYHGNLWNIIEPLLAPNRTHTALSVGDEVEIDGVTYLCADFGWEKVGA